jgi:hypothetical protein
MAADRQMFRLEALEPRILLSGDGVDGAANPPISQNDGLDEIRDGLNEIPGLVTQIAESADQLGQELPLIGRQHVDAYDPGQHVQDLFAGLTPDSFATPEALDAALDSLPGTQADVLIDESGNVQVDLVVSDSFEKPVTVAVGTATSDGMSLQLDTQATLFGDWELRLRLYATDGSPSTLDPQYSSIILSLNLDSPMTTSAVLDTQEVELAVTDLRLDAVGRVDFLDPDGDGAIALSDFTNAANTGRTAAGYSGSGTLVAQLVDTLHAPNSPPDIQLDWLNIDDLSPSISGSYGAPLPDEPELFVLETPAPPAWTFLDGTLSLDLTLTATQQVTLASVPNGPDFDLQFRHSLTGEVIGSVALADTVGVTVLGSALDDFFVVDYYEPFSLLNGISFTDSYETDLDTLSVVGLSDLTWTVTGPGAGVAGEVQFAGIESLVGDSDNNDTFVVEAGGSLRSGVDGGDGGWDTLSVDNDGAAVVTVTATDAHSGTIGVDGIWFAYGGLEPLTFSGTANEMVYDLTAGSDELRLVDASTLFSRMMLDSLNGTFEDTTFDAPSVSLTIRMGLGDDTISIDGDSFPALFSPRLTGPPGVRLNIDGQEGADTLVFACDSDYVLKDASIEAGPTVLPAALWDGLSLASMDNARLIPGPTTNQIDAAGFSGLVLYDGLYDGITVTEGSGLNWYNYGTPNWTSQGPGPITGGQVAGIPNGIVAGAIQAIAAHPTDPNIIYIGSVNGGVWRTRNALAATDAMDNDGDGLVDGADPSEVVWEPLTDQFPSLAISALAFDLDDPRTLYAGTGSLSSSSDVLPGGQPLSLLKTVNGGDTWELMTDLDLFGVTIYSIVARGSHVLVAGSDGLYLSTSGGATETFSRVLLPGDTLVSPDTSVHVTDLVAGDDWTADPAHPGPVYAALTASSDPAHRGIFRSIDGGQTWRDVSADIHARNPDDLPNAIRIRMAVGAGGVLYAAVIRVTNAMTPAAAVTWGTGSTVLRVSTVEGYELGDEITVSDSINTDGDTPGHEITITRIDASNNRITISRPLTHTYSNPNPQIQITKRGQPVVKNRVFRIYRTADEGANWVSMGVPGDTDGGINPGGQADRHFSIAADPDVANLVYVGGDRELEGLSGNFPTTPNANGARNWTGRIFSGSFSPGTSATAWTPLVNRFADPDGPGGAAGTAPHADSRALVFDANGDLLESDDGGIYKLRDPLNVVNARQWIALDGNLNLTEFYSVAWDPWRDVIIGGAQDVGNVLQAATGDNAWTTLSGGDGAVVQVTSDGASSSSYYFSYIYLDDFFRQRISAGLPTTTAVGTAGVLDLNSTPGSSVDVRTIDRMEFIQPWVLNQVDSTRMLIGTNYLYESTNGGARWTLLNGNPLPSGGAWTLPVGAANLGPITAMVYGGRQPDGSGGFINQPAVIYAGTFAVGSVGTFHVRQSAAGAITQVTSWPGAGIRHIAVSPNDWRQVFVLDTNGAIWTSSNGDAAHGALVWTPVDTVSLGEITRLATEIQRLEVVNVGSDLVLLAGGLGGVYRCLNPLSPNARWSEFGNNLPNMLVTDLHYEEADDLLLVGTHGRGAWTMESAARYLASPSRLMLTGANGINELGVVDDNFYLVRNAQEPWMLDIFQWQGFAPRPSLPVFSVPLYSLENITINARDGWDHVTIDSSNGPISVPGQITVVGGSGEDSLFFEGEAIGWGTKRASSTGVGHFVLSGADLFWNSVEQRVFWSEIENVDDGRIDLIGPLENIRKSWDEFAKVVGQAIVAITGGSDAPALSPGSVMAGLNGLMTKSSKVVADPIFAASQVAEGGLIQIDNGTSVLRRLFEDGDRSLQLADIGSLIATAEDLELALEALDDIPDNVSYDPLTGTFDVQIVKPLTAVVALDVDAEFAGAGIKLAGGLEVSAVVELNLVFGTDSQGFFVRPNTASDDYELKVYDVQVGANIEGRGHLGFLGVDVEGASLTMDDSANVGFGFKLHDPGTDDADGLIRLFELFPDNVSELATFALQGDPSDGNNDDLVLAGSFRVSALLPGLEDPFALGALDVTLAWPDFANPLDVILTASGGINGDIQRFLKLSSSGVLDQLQDLKLRLAQVAALESAFGLDVPYLDETQAAVADLLDVATAIDREVIGPLTSDVDGSARFSSAQELAVRLASQLGRSLEEIGLTYQDGKLMFNALFTHVFDPQPVELAIGAGDMLGLAFDPLTVDLEASLTADLTFGYDLASLLDPAAAFFFRPNELSATLSAVVSDLDWALDLGLLSASLQDTSVGLAAGVTLRIDDPSADGDITLADLQTIVADPLGAQVGATVTTEIAVASPSVSAVLGIEGALGVEISKGDAAIVLFNTLDTDLATQAPATYAFDLSGTAAPLGLDGVLDMEGVVGARVNTTGLALERLDVGGTGLDLVFSALEANAQTFTLDGYLSFAGSATLAGQLTFDLTPATYTIGFEGGPEPPRTATALRVGGADLRAFFGSGGPYWRDSNGDGRITSADVPEADGAVGLTLQGLAFGGVLFQPEPTAGDPNPTRAYYALRAGDAADIAGQVDRTLSAALVGVDGVTLTSNDLRLNLNGAADSDPGAPTPPAVDFSSLPGGALTVTTALGPVTLDFTGSVKEVYGAMAGAVAGFVDVGGQFGFRLAGTAGAETLEAAAGQVTATLQLGSIEVGVTDGTLALVINPDGTMAAQATGDLHLVAPDFLNATATSVAVETNDTAVDYAAAPVTIVIGGISAPLAVGLDTQSVSVTGLAADLEGLVAISGNFDFRRSTTDAGAPIISVAVNDVALALGDGTTEYVTVSGGTGGMLINQNGFAGKLSVTADTSAIPGIDVGTTDFTLALNTTQAAVTETFSIGADSYTLDVPGGPYLRVEASTSLTVLATTLTGTIGFEQTTLTGGASIVVISVRDIAIGGFDGTGSGGSPVDIAGAHGLLVVTSGGVGGALAFAADAAFGAFEAGASLKLEINTAVAAIDVSGAFGAVQLEGGPFIRIVAGLELILPGLEIEGDFSFQQATENGSPVTVLVGVNVRVFAGDNSDPDHLIGLELTDGRAQFIQYPGSLEAGQISGRVRLLGVDGVTFDATLVLSYNETGVVVDHDLFVAGDHVVLSLPVGTSSAPFIQFAGQDVLLSLAGLMELRGDVTVTRKFETPDRFLIGMAGDAFVGAGPAWFDYDTVNPDAIGVVVEAATLGLVLLTTGKLAFDGKGKLGLLGLGGLNIHSPATSLFGLRLNLTDGPVDDVHVPLLGHADQIVDFDDSLAVPEFTGTGAIGVTNAFEVGGAIHVRRRPAGEVEVTITDAALKIGGTILVDGNDANDDPLFAVAGRAAFTVGGSQGFRLQEFRITAVTINGTVLNVPVPDLTMLPLTADLVSPFDGGTIEPSNSLEVEYVDVNGAGLTGIGGDEFRIWKDGEDITDNLDLVTLSEVAGYSNRYRYDFSAPFTAGEYSVIFLPGGWSDGNNSAVAAETESFLVTGVGSTLAPTAHLADPSGGVAVDPAMLNARRYLDVTFVSRGGASIDSASIGGNEFTLSGSALLDAVPDGAPALLFGTTYRYSFRDNNPTNDVDLFGPGTLQVMFAAGGFTAGGSGNLAKTETIVLDAAQSATADTTGTFTLGPISVTNPSIGIEDIGFADRKVIVTVGIHVGAIALFGDHSDLVTASTTNVLATFDLGVGLPGNFSLSPTGKFSFGAASLEVSAPAAFTFTADDVLIQYSPTGGAGQTLAEIKTSASLMIVPFGVTLDITASDNNPALVVTGHGFTLGRLDVPVTVTVPGENPLKEVLTLGDLTIGVEDFGFNFDSGSTQVGSIFLSATSAVLLPNLDTPELDGVATIADGVDEDTFGLTGTLEADGDIVFTFDLLSAEVQGVFELSASSGSVKVGPGMTADALLEVTTATLTLPLLGTDTALSVTGFEIARDGALSATSIEFVAGSLFEDTLGLGGLLPYKISSVTVTGRGSDERIALDAFDVTVHGALNLSDFPIFADLPATPVIEIGGSNLLDGEDYPFTVGYDHGAIVFSTELITLGFTDLNMGPLTMDLLVTLGKFVDGVFNTDEFAADLTVTAAGVTVELGAKGLGTQDGITTLSLTATLSGQFEIGDFIDVEHLSARFDLLLTVDDSFEVQEAKLELAQAQAAVTVDFEGAMSFSGSASLNFQAAPDELFATFGTLSATFPGLGDIPGLANLRGTVTRFAIGREPLPGRGFLPVLLDGFSVVLQSDGLSGEDLDLDWLPITISALGVAFKVPGINPGDPITAPIRLDGAHAVDVVLIISGGVDLTGIGGVELPGLPDKLMIAAEVRGLRLNLGALARGDFLAAIDGLDGAFVEPFELGPVEIGGGFAFETISEFNPDGTPTGVKALIVTVRGFFSVAGYGGGIELVITNVGPIVARVEVPLAIPLGPTGLLLTGVGGGFSFGLGPIPSPPTPQDLLMVDEQHESDLFGRMQFDSQDIAADVFRLVHQGELTWSLPFRIFLDGTIAAATSDLLAGTIRLGLDIDTSAPTPEVKFFGVGEITAIGMPLGRVGALLDFSKPLAPVYSFAMRFPVQGSPLAFLLPVAGEYSVRLDTKGVVDSVVVGLQTLISRMVGGVVGVGLEHVASTLQANRFRPLALLVLEGQQEDMRIDAQLLGQRLPALLAEAVGLIDGSAGDQERAARIVNSLLSDLLDAAGSVLAGDGERAAFLNELSRVVTDAAITAVTTAGSVFDPSLEISGSLQPTILGIPFGDALVAGRIALSKNGLEVEFEGSIQRIINKLSSLQTGPLGELAATVISAGFSDQFHFLFELKNIGIFESIFAGQPLNISPLGDWTGGFSGTLQWLGFDLAEISGFVFSPGNEESVDAQTRRDILGGDLVFDDDRIPITGPDAATVESRRQALIDFGGILLTGRLFAPAMLVDPVGRIADLSAATEGKPFGLFTPPEDLLQIPDYVGKLLSEEGLLADQELARLQFYVPAFAPVLALGSVLDSDGNDTGAVEVQLSGAVDTLVEIMSHAYLSGFVGGFGAGQEAKILSLPIGRLLIDATPEGFHLLGEVPLIGAQVSFDIDFREVNVLDMVEDLSGLVPGLDPLDFTGADPIFMRIPVASGMASLSSGDLEDFLAGSFGLPPNIFGANSVEALVEIYSPGFADAPGPNQPAVPLIQRRGGIGIHVNLNIVDFIEDAAFDFEAALFSSGLPEFTARAHVDRLSIPGQGPAPASILIASLNVDIVSERGVLTVGLDGTLRLLELLTFTVHGDLAVHSDPAHPGIYGALDLQIADGQPTDLRNDVFALSGRFTLQVNTTDQQHGSVSDGPLLGIHVGGLDPDPLAHLTILGFTLDGSFDMTLSLSSVSVAGEASMDLRVLGIADPVFSFDASGGMLIDSTGVAASFSLDLDPGAVTALGFDLSGSFTLKVNTTGRRIRRIGDVAVDIPANDPDGYLAQVHVAGSLAILDVFTIAGTFDLSVSESRIFVAGGGTMEVRVPGMEPPLFVFTAGGGLLIDSRGIGASFSMELGANALAGLGFDMNGTFTLKANTTGEDIDELGLRATDYLMLHLDGDMSIADGALFADGNFDLELTNQGFSAEAEGSLSLNIRDVFLLGDVSLSGAFSASIAFVGTGACGVGENGDPYYAGGFEGRFSVGDFSLSIGGATFAADVDLFEMRMDRFGRVTDIPGVGVAGLFLDSLVQHVYVDDQRVSERAETRSRDIVVRLSRPAERRLEIAYAFESGSAAAGADWDATGGTVIVDPERNQAIISVNILRDDNANEPEQDFHLEILSATYLPNDDFDIFLPALILSDACGTITIVDRSATYVDDDVDVTVTTMGAAAGSIYQGVLQARVPEDGSGKLVIAVQNLSLRDSVGVKVTYVPLGENLSNATIKDFSIGLSTTYFLTGALPFRTISIARDDVYELHEAFELQIELVQEARLADSTTLHVNRVLGIIQNDDSDIPPGALVFFDFDRLAPGGGSYVYDNVPEVFDPRVVATSFEHVGDVEIDRAVQFASGYDQVMGLRGDGPMLPTSNFVLDVFIRAGTQDGRGTIVSLGADNGLSLFVENGLIQYRVTNRAGDVFTGNVGAVSIGQWQHVALAYGSATVGFSTLACYLDGVRTQLAMIEGAVRYGEQQVLVGAAPAVASTFAGDPRVTDVFEGDVDELHLWNTTLSEAFLSSLPHRDVTGAESGLLIDYRFDERPEDLTRTGILANRTGRGWNARWGGGTAGIFGPFGRPDSIAAQDSPLAGLPRYSTGSRVETQGVPKVEPVDPTSDPTSAITSNAWTPTGAASAGPWDVTDDFSTENGNPNGAWTYGWMDNAFTTFTPYVNRIVNAWIGWGADGTPAAWFNIYGDVINGVAPGQLSLHPGDGAQPAVARWTAPAGVSGTARIAGQFFQGDSGAMQVAVRINGATAWSSVDAGAFELEAVVQPGDTIDFAVYGGYAYGNTPLDAQIVLEAPEQYYRVTVGIDAPFEDGVIAIARMASLVFSGVDFFYRADFGGPARWELRTSLDDFTEAIAGGAIDPGIWRHRRVLFDEGVGIRSTRLHPSEAIEFRLYGLDAEGDGAWAIDNFALIGGVAEASSFNLAPIAHDFTVIAVVGESSPAIDPVGNASDPDGDPVAVVGVPTVPAAIGTLIENIDGTFTFTPAPDQTVNPVLAFTLADRWGATATALVTIDVRVPDVNDVPAAGDFNFAIAEDTSSAGGGSLLTGLVDPEGDPLTAVLLRSVGHGALMFNADGTFVYQPAADFNGVDSFQYAAYDGIGEGAPGTVTFTIAPRPDAPRPVADVGYTVERNQTLDVPAPGVLGNDSDPEGDVMTAQLVTGVFNGVLTFNTNGSFTYRPNNSFVGVDSFTYRPRDAGLAGATTRVVIAVTRPNLPPSVAGETIELNEGQSVTIAAGTLLANDSDPEGGPLRVVSTGTTLHGTVTPTFDAGGALVSVVYTPAPNFMGADSFTYEVRDAGGLSASARVLLQVRNVNDAPVAATDIFVLRLSETVTSLTVSAPGVLANDSDIDGDRLTAIFIAPPAHADTFTHASDGSFVYTPEAGFRGVDSFTYTARDSQGVLSNVATVLIRVLDDIVSPPVGSGGGLPGSGGSITIIRLPGQPTTGIVTRIGGRVPNSYVADARVFFDADLDNVWDFSDLNGNGEFDADEPSEPFAVAGLNGAYEMAVPSAFDTNGNGFLEIEEGVLVATGGILTGSGGALPLSLRAPVSSEVISPLTSLLTTYMFQSGLRGEDAMLAFTSVLGIPFFDVTLYDPIAATAAGEAEGPAVLAAHKKVGATYVLGSAALSAATGRALDMAGSAVMSAMAGELARSLAAGEYVDLADPATIARILTAAAGPDAQVLGATRLGVMGQAIAAVTHAVDAIVAPGGLAYVEAVTRAESAAYGPVLADLAEFSAGRMDADTLLARTTGAALDALIAGAPVGLLQPPAEAGATLGNLYATRAIEGGATALSAIVDGADPAAELALQITWGDGSHGRYDLAPGTTFFQFAHSYDDDPAGPEDAWPIGIVLFVDGVAVDAATVQAEAVNAAPAVGNVLYPSLVVEGGTVRLKASVTDPGAGDQLTVSVQWGDGASGLWALGQGTGLIDLSHVYDLPGAHTILLTVSDADGGSVILSLDVLVAPAASPELGSLEIAGGGNKPALVRGFELILDQPVTVDPDLIDLTRQDGVAFTVTAENPSGDGRTWVLGFFGPGTMNGSLPDGNFTLTVGAAAVVNDLGDPLAAGAEIEFYVLAGDANGDRVTNDLDLYRVWQDLQRPSTLRDVANDLNGDSIVDQGDIAVVAGNYLAQVPPPATFAAADSGSTKDVQSATPSRPSSVEASLPSTPNTAPIAKTTRASTSVKPELTATHASNAGLFAAPFLPASRISHMELWNGRWAWVRILNHGETEARREGGGGAEIQGSNPWNSYRRLFQSLEVRWAVVQPLRVSVPPWFNTLDVGAS